MIYASRPARYPLIIAAALWLASLVVFAPGVAEYDTVEQFRQVLSGHYDDWHPPVMAWLWRRLLPFGDGATPLLVFQLTGYWLGLGLIAGALARAGRAGSGWMMLLIGLLPLFLGWQVVVLKDTQLVGAALGGTGLVAWWRLRDRPVPAAALLLAALLFGYALLVRANAAFALAPLIAGLLPTRRVGELVVTAAIFIALTLAVAGPVNHQLIGARPSGMEKTQPLYDLAGIAVRAPGSRAVGLSHEAGMALRAHHCVTPYFWDPLGDVPACVAAVRPLQAQPAGDLYLRLANAALHHPLAYLAQRVAHWNMTERWLVPARLPGAAPEAGSEPNRLGLASPGAEAQHWQWLAAQVALTPIAWPFAWLLLALLLLVGTRRWRPSPTRQLAIALLASAITLEFSFVAISIATDLRYHLWPMLATALAAVLLADTYPLRRVPGWMMLLAALCVAAGVVQRAVLPTPPLDYEALLHWCRR
ncbi:hypothetical protein [Sphingomonas sp. BK235]|uniref:hypothetical protein n=1 Tax=Sphingomonas sp. BK235 TaxID=2512131 RepID=UPI0010524564|nr:hypothetical protein [Sphingomonas sp. BK235]TCP33378.1 hypothetical protein EV292_106321 [Sphingomonas sp. BK235]